MDGWKVLFQSMGIKQRRTLTTKQGDEQMKTKQQKFQLKYQVKAIEKYRNELTDKGK